MVDVPIVDGLIRNAEVEAVLEADTVFGLIDNSDAPSRNDQQRKLKVGRGFFRSFLHVSVLVSPALV